MTVIGITLYPRQPEGMTPQVRQDIAYVDAVHRAGGVPLLIPPIADTGVVRRLYDLCDGLCVPGGPDVDPALYGETARQGTKIIAPEAEQVEVQLLRWALDEGKPMFVICRGQQLLNVVRGGSLWQDLIEDGVTTVQHQIKTARDEAVHDITIQPGSALARITGEERVLVNSVHHQAIRDLGRGLSVSARSDDGIIEGVEIADHPFCIGVQCHPEVLSGVEPWAKALFVALVEASAAARSRAAGSDPGGAGRGVAARA